MESAKFDRNTITLTSDDSGTIFKASGSVIKFDGFLKIYKDQKKGRMTKIYCQKCQKDQLILKKF